MHARHASAIAGRACRCTAPHHAAISADPRRSLLAVLACVCARAQQLCAMMQMWDRTARSYTRLGEIPLQYHPSRSHSGRARPHALSAMAGPPLPAPGPPACSSYAQFAQPGPRGEHQTCYAMSRVVHADTIACVTCDVRPREKTSELGPHPRRFNPA